MVCDTVFVGIISTDSLNGHQYQSLIYAQRLVRLVQSEQSEISNTRADDFSWLSAVFWRTFLHLNLNIGWQVNDTNGSPVY